MARAEDLLVGLLARTERDKAELARQLHGELGGALAAARMTLSRLAPGTADAELLAQVDAQVAQAQAVKQRLVEALHPGLLGHFGIGVALSAHCEAVCRAAGVSFTAEVAQDLPNLAPEPAILMYRLGEAAARCLLGSRPRTLQLAVSHSSGAVRLCVACDAPAAALASDAMLGTLVQWLARTGGEVRFLSSEGNVGLEASLMQAGV